MSTLKRDLSNLPQDRESGEGLRPHKEALQYLRPLAEKWYERYLGGGNDERAFAVEGTRFRASWAGGCARANGYRILHNDAKQALHLASIADPLVPAVTEQLQAAVKAWAPTNPPTLADAWRMGLGSMVHDAFQEVFTVAYPGAEIEVAVDLRPDVDGSATVDILVTEHHDELRVDMRGEEGIAANVPTRTLIELKTSNGFGFKKAVIPFKGPAEGPKFGHKAQACLAGDALGVDRVIIGYLSMENISVDVAKRHGLDDVERFLAGWVIERDEVARIAEEERKSITRILEVLDEGKLPPRVIRDGELPAGNRIQAPESGFWTVVRDGAITDSGTTWWCGYCWHRDRCITDGGTAPDGGMVEIPVELRVAR